MIFRKVHKLHKLREKKNKEKIKDKKNEELFKKEIDLYKRKINLFTNRNNYLETFFFQLNKDDYDFCENCQFSYKFCDLIKCECKRLYCKFCNTIKYCNNCKEKLCDFCFEKCINCKNN